jgi:hypothetical protein
MNKLLIPYLLAITGLLLALPACGNLYDADMYECESDNGLVLWTCVVGTGPPTDQCGAKSSGRTTTKPHRC